MKRLVLILLLFIPSILYSQESFVEDSLTLNLQLAKNDSARVNTLWKLSGIYRNSNLKKSLSYADSALIVAKEDESQNFLALSYQNVGEVLFKMGFADRALENYLLCKKILDEQKDTVRLISLNHNVGGIYYQMFDYENALKYFKEALGVCNEMLVSGDSVYSGKMQIIYNSIGSAYDLTGEKDLALNYFQKAEQCAKIHHDYFNLGAIYNNMGKFYGEQGDNEKALSFLGLSLENRKRINDKNGMARSYLFLSNHYCSIGDFAKALTSVESAMRIIKMGGNMRSQKDAFDLLFKINKEMGNVDEALDAHMTYVSLKDSLFNEASVKEITRLQMQFEFEKKEKLMEMEQRRKELLYVYSISVLVLGMIIVALFYAWQRSRTKELKTKNQNVEIKLEALNKKMTTHIMYLLKKNELIKELSTKLINFKSSLAIKAQLPIQKIIFEMNSLTEEDVWEEFELRFQEVHSKFYINLSKQFPGLSPSERKLCAFLRLNMTTKEISSITHQNPKSLEVSRSRLRKKLDINNKDVNLVTFLSNM